jgi:predicted ATPase
MLRGVALARRQGALSWELRSTMSLSKLWARQGRTEQALEALLAVYGRHAKGFEARDLVGATKLIEELRARPALGEGLLPAAPPRSGF